MSLEAKNRSYETLGNQTNKPSKKVAYENTVNK